VRDQQLLVPVELDPLHRGVLDPEQPAHTLPLRTPFPTLS